VTVKRPAEVLEIDMYDVEFAQDLDLRLISEHPLLDPVSLLVPYVYMQLRVVRHRERFERPRHSLYAYCFYCLSVFAGSI
jgi:hypothetical protein